MAPIGKSHSQSPAKRRKEDRHVPGTELSIDPTRSQNAAPLDSSYSVGAVSRDALRLTAASSHLANSSVPKCTAASVAGVDSGTTRMAASNNFSASLPSRSNHNAAPTTTGDLGSMAISSYSSSATKSASSTTSGLARNQRVELPSHVKGMVSVNDKLVSGRTCKNPTCKCRKDRKPNNKGNAGRNGYWSTVDKFPLVIEKGEAEEDKLAELINHIETKVISKHSKTNIKCFSAWKPQGVKKGIKYDKNGIFQRCYTCRYHNNGHCTCKIQIHHKSGEDHAQLQWFREGSAHMQQNDGHVASLEEHHNFQHVRLTGPKKLPFALEESIEQYVESSPSSSYQDVREHLRDLKSDDGKALYDLTEEQWSSMWTQIDHYRDRVASAIIAESLSLPTTDALRDIQEFAEANTLQNMITKLGDDFTEHTMFVSGIEIIPVAPPADDEEHRKWVKAGSPKHIVRVALTNFVMSSFVPAIASRSDLMDGRIVLSSDMTFKLFVGKYELIDLFCHDGAMNGKLMGFLITANNKPSDYFFLANCCQNVTRWLCSQTKLPGRAKMPFRLPLPVPPCNARYPMKYNVTLGLFEQHPDATEDEFEEEESDRYKSTKSEDVRAGISSNAKYYPEIVPTPPDGVAKSFSMGIKGTSYPSLSDGDISIKQGIGAAIPAAGNLHGTCNVHQLRNDEDVVHAKKKEYVEDGKVPIFHSKKTNEADKNKDIKKARGLFYNFINKHLMRVKFSSNRALSDIMFQDLLDRLRDGRVDVQSEDGNTTHICGDFSGYADYLSVSFNRWTKNGCQGVWRYSDLLDLDATAMDGDGRLTNAGNPKPDRIRGPYCDNTNTDEAQHLHFKDRLDNIRRTVPEQLAKIMEEGENYTKDEVVKAGVSPLPLVYGSHRVSTTYFSADRDVGMLFLGTHTSKFDEQTIRQYGRLRHSGRGMKTKIYMLRSIEELEQLKTSVEDTGRDEAAIIDEWLVKFKLVSEATKDQLEEMIADAVADYVKNEGISNEAARTEAIDDLYHDERTFVICTPIQGDVSQDHVQITEPFRSMSTYTGTMMDRNVVYKWRCGCERGLKSGFCGNIFFLQHCSTLRCPGLNEDELRQGGYIGTPIPSICFGHDPGIGKGRGRPLIEVSLLKQPEGMKPVG